MIKLTIEWKDGTIEDEYNSYPIFYPDLNSFGTMDKNYTCIQVDLDMKQIKRIIWINEE